VKAGVGLRAHLRDLLRLMMHVEQPQLITVPLQAFADLCRTCSVDALIILVELGVFQVMLVVLMAFPTLLGVLSAGVLGLRRVAERAPAACRSFDTAQTVSELLRNMQMLDNPSILTHATALQQQLGLSVSLGSARPAAVAPPTASRSDMRDRAGSLLPQAGACVLLVYFYCFVWSVSSCVLAACRARLKALACSFV
jgi:hypothetical protein